MTCQLFSIKLSATRWTPSLANKFVIGRHVSTSEELQWLNIIITVINEQCIYECELGNQSCTDETRLRMLTTAMQRTYKYVQLRHRFPFCRNVAEVMNFQWTSSMANSVMHWRIHTFLDVSAALLYIVHWNYANALILMEILVIVKCLVNVKHCSNFYAEEEFILYVRDADCCWVSKVSCVVLLEKCFELIYASWAISANNYLGKLFRNLF